MSLNLTGAIYPTFIEHGKWYQADDLVCIQRVVTKLRDVQTSGERPGMLLGKIQSGKTKTFLGAVALAFDNGFDIAIILTKGTKALTRQTLARVNRDFVQFRDRDQLQIYDIMAMPDGLTGYELSQRVVIVAKQIDNLEHLEAIFREQYPQLQNKRVLIIDDEADYASVGFRNLREMGVDINVTGRRIDQLRATLGGSAFFAGNRYALLPVLATRRDGHPGDRVPPYTTCVYRTRSRESRLHRQRLLLRAQSGQGIHRLLYV